MKITIYIYVSQPFALTTKIHCNQYTKHDKIDDTCNGFICKIDNYRISNSIIF